MADDRPPASADTAPSAGAGDDEAGGAGALDRRSFLTRSLLGAGVLLPGLRAPDLAETASPATPPIPPIPPIPAKADNWVEPWEFRVGRLGDGPLALNVVEVPAPAWLRELGPETLYTYNGSLPGPTVRMRGDDVLRVDLYNHLSANAGRWARFNSSRFARYTKVRGYSDADHPDGAFQANEPVPDIEDWRLARTLIYGPHDQHTTSLHTHGLHVAPARNPDGTHSDNVLMRVIPPEDFTLRMAHDPPLPLDPEHEVLGHARYEFRLGSSSRTPTHPPGTHWYHPHPHGATYDQVTTGMAGFLIVEGDVDDVLNGALSQDPRHGYRERLFLLQRIFDVSKAPIEDGEGAGANRRGKKQSAINTVNGQPAGALSFEMAAGAVERWRVLNGSVDGQGYLFFAVLPAGAEPPVAPGADGSTPTYDEVEAGNAALAQWARETGLPMEHLAYDGVTLVEQTPDGSTRYRTRTTSAVALAPANRCDVIFQAPASPGEYVVLGVGDSHRPGDPPPPLLHVATVTVTASDDPAPPLPEGHLTGLLSQLEVPAYHTPVADAELSGIDPRSGEAGSRTRRLVYSGWGDGGYSCPDGCTKVGTGGRNSMVIDRMKYDPARPVQVMAQDTAEEWVLDNWSVGKPLSGGGAVDHPFHIHQNPFWVMAVLEPKWTNRGSDADPEWVFDGWTDTLDYPRWQDVIPIPANGGRVIVRSRFPDYTGFYVHHCHLLQHEDWGMMQAVEIVWDPADANNDWTQAPYDANTNPRGPYGEIRPSKAGLEEHCQTFFALDGAIVDGKIQPGTPVRFCTCPATGGAASTGAP